MGPSLESHADPKALTPDRARHVAENLGLAYAIAREYRGRGLDLEELRQEAAIGAIHAAAYLDPDRGEYRHFVATVVHSHLRGITRPSTRRWVAERERSRPDAPSRSARSVADERKRRGLHADRLRGRTVHPEGSEDHRWPIGDRDDLRRRVDALEDPARSVLRLWCGLDPDGPLALSEVARRLGRTREVVERIHRNAVAGLRTTYRDP